MRIAIIGSGSMGSLFGGLFRETGHEIVFVDLWEEHVTAIQEDGLTIVDPDGTERTVEATATTDPSTVDPVDLLLPFVKSYHTKAAVDDAAPLIDDETELMTLQNGFENPEILASYVDEERVIAGTTTMSAEVVDPGRVVHRDIGETIIGQYFVDNDQRVERIASALSGSIAEIETTDAIRDQMWNKVLVNLTYNPICALSRVRVGDVIDDPAGRELIRAVIDETRQVAETRGRTIRNDAVEFIFSVGENHRSHKTSMRHDVEENRRTEIDYLGGAIVEYADEKDVLAPVNRTLTNLVKIADGAHGDDPSKRE